MTAAPAPHLIGIAGPSASGKTSLALLAARRLPGGALVFALDSYYRDQRGVPEEVINVDVPEALEHALIVSDLEALASGRSIEQPVYDYATHARLPQRRAVDPAPFILVEGLYSLYWPAVRRLFTTRVFIDLDHEECLRRRVARDTRERGRSAEAVTAMYEQRVRPMYERHVQPTRVYAGLVLDGREPVERMCDRLLDVVLRRKDGAA
jgi:uridine kinase